MNRNYNFIATSMIPSETQLVIHEKPEERVSWETHGIDGWHIAPALNHIVM